VTVKVQKTIIIIHLMIMILMNKKIILISIMIQDQIIIMMMIIININLIIKNKRYNKKDSNKESKLKKIFLFLRKFNYQEYLKIKKLKDL
jgi:hypothetical protein